MRRTLAVLATVVSLAGLAVVLVTPSFAASGPVRLHAQQTTLGFYRGHTVSYLDFGPVKLRPGNRVAPIWAFTNGTEGQVNIIDTVPGRADYTPLWAVRMVTWKDGATPRVLTSAAAVRKALTAGQVSIASPGIVVNCPVL